MGGVLSATEAITTMAIWPVAAMTELKDGDALAAVAGVAIGVGAPLYLFGNPVELVQNQEFVTLAFAYGIGGAGYLAGSTLKKKFVPA